MAIADRLCLVREWLDRNEIRKARAAYDEGKPLFDAGKTMQDTHFADSDVERILAEIDAVREELEAAERTAATAPVVAGPGDVPTPCKPENNEMKGELNEKRIVQKQYGHADGWQDRPSKNS